MIAKIKNKKKAKKQFEKSTGKVRETRLCMRASKGSTFQHFVRKKRGGKYAHAHMITSGRTTTQHHRKCGFVRANILLRTHKYM
jgi:hypothetical protein